MNISVENGWGMSISCRELVTLLQGRPLISVHIIGWRKTKLSIKRKLFQPVQSGNSLRVLGRFRWFRNFPDNLHLHASANSEICTYISDFCGSFWMIYILMNRQIPAQLNDKFLFRTFSFSIYVTWKKSKIWHRSTKIHRVKIKQKYRMGDI
jgi:hypothetical protein